MEKKFFSRKSIKNKYFYTKRYREEEISCESVRKKNKIHMGFTTTFTDKKKLLIIIEFTYNILAFFWGGGGAGV